MKYSKQNQRRSGRVKWGTRGPQTGTKLLLLIYGQGRLGGLGKGSNNQSESTEFKAIQFKVNAVPGNPGSV